MKANPRVIVAVVVASVALGGAFAAPAWAKSDKQIARASTLRITDFPSGWTTSPHKESPPSKLPACRPTVTVDKKSAKYKASAPDFSQGSGASGSQVTNSVYVFPSVKQATAYLAAFQLPTTKDCLQQGLDQQLKGSGETATVAGLDVSGGPVDDGVGFTATLQGGSGASAQTVIFQAVAFRVGRAVTGFTTQNPTTAFPETVSLVKTEVARLKQNLAAG